MAMFWIVLFLVVLFVLPIIYTNYDDYKNGRITKKSDTFNFSDDLYNNMMAQIMKWYKKEEYCPYEIQSISIGRYSDPVFQNRSICIRIVTRENKRILEQGFNEVFANYKNNDWKANNKAKNEFFNIFPSQDIYDTHCESVPFGFATDYPNYATGYDNLKRAVIKYNKEHFSDANIQID